MTDLPPPLVPAEVDLRDFSFTPMYRARLFGSAFHARATDAEWRAGVTLWLKSQDQVPAGSLPDDDIDLCRLAELGRDTKTWKKIRSGALHGWFKCSDGRLYNEVTAEVALAQWQGKVGQRLRTLKARIAALEKRYNQATDPAVKADLMTQWQNLRQTLLDMPLPSATPPVTGDVTASKGEGERQGKGQGLSKNSEAKASGAVAPISTDVATKPPAPPPAAPVAQTAPAITAAPEDLLEIPLHMVVPEDGDWGKALFGPGLRWLMSITGRKDAPSRAFLGKCLQSAQQNHRAVFDLLARAQREKMADPTAWISASLKKPINGARTLPRQDRKSPYEIAVDTWQSNGCVGPAPKRDAFARASA